MDEKNLKRYYNEAMSIIKSHIEQKNTVKDFLKNRRYDKNDKNYRKAIGKDALIVLNAAANEMRKNCKENLETYKLTDNYLKRRQSAIMEYAPLFAEKFEDTYPDLIIEESLTDFCSQGFFFLPDDFVETYISLALAIAILDKLYDNRLIWDILPYIPTSEKILSEVKLPFDYEDAVYDNDLLKGMMYLIIHRDNADDIFYNAKTVKRTKENVPKRNHITLKSSDDSNSIEKRASQQKIIDTMSCRERMDIILSAIQPEVIEKSEQDFRDKVYEFMNIVLTNTCSYEKELVKYITELCDIYEKLCSHEEKMSEALMRRKKLTDIRNACSKKKSILSPYRAPIIIDDGHMDNITSAVIDAMPNANIIVKTNDLDEYEQMVGMISKMDKIYDQINANKEKQSELSTKTERYYSYSANYILWKYGNIDSPSEHKKIAELLTDVEEFTIDDPYEICFGFFSLLESGDNIVWLLPLAGAVLSKAVERLPWVNIRNKLGLSRNLSSYSEKHADTPIDKTDDKTDDNDKADDKADDNDDKNIDPSVMYDLCYTDYIDLSNRGTKRVRKDKLMNINFAQLVYRQTGINIARANYLRESDIRNLVKSNVNRKNSDLLKIILESYRQVTNRIKPYDAYIIASDNEAEENAALRKAISAKDSEISQLKTALHKAESELRNERENISRIKADTETERRELAELRELIYNIQNDNDSNIEDNDEQITLPYTVKSNIVIFGGHDSWLKVFKTFIKNVRIIEPSTNPDINLIRHADVVWMQTNAMPHSYYNKIMDIVRQRKIPVKYFAYASAEKCARQLAVEDINANK